MLPDIATRADLEQLLRRFYETLLLDATMRHIFVDVAQLDLATHLPHLVDFWEQALLQANGYKRNVLVQHVQLHHKIPLTAVHFQQWLAVFEETVNSLFEGSVAQQAKNRAQSVALVIQSKLARL